MHDKSNCKAGKENPGGALDNLSIAKAVICSTIFSFEYFTKIIL
jgi:hypothetical protein